MKHYYLIVLALILFLVSGCNNNQDFIYGKWQSLNNSEKVIEFTEKGEYILYDHREPVFSENDKIGKVLFEYMPSKKHYNLRLFGEKSNKTIQKAHIEVVDENRIRVFYFKHLNILDVADEFYRTDNLTDGDKIINRLYKEAYKQIKSK